MQYVYFLQSQIDKDLYIGCTNNLKRRFTMHNAKKVVSTAKRVPFALTYYESYINKTDAFNREQYMKTGWGKNILRKH